MAFALRNYQYLILALLVGLLVLGVAILLPSIGLLTIVFADSAVSLSDKLYLLLSLLSSLITNFTIFSAFTTITTALLIGINVSLILYLYKRQRARLDTQGIVASSLGVFLAMFGVGCAACGSLLLMTLLSLFGGIGVLTALPFRGQEIGALGVLILCVATFFLAQNITRPVTCEIR